MLLSGRTVTSKQFLWQIQTLTVSVLPLFVPWAGALRATGAGTLFPCEQTCVWEVVGPVPSGAAAGG